MADDTEHSDFVQKLIDAVRERRCLYDKKHIAYFNRREREKAWRQIGQQLGRSDVDCHKRWKLLREKLAKELKKRDKALESGEVFQSDWACFESIMFVEDHISPRKKLEKQPLMLVKDLSKKRNFDSSIDNSFGPAEKRVYNANDFNFFMQLSKAAADTTAHNIESPSCSVVKVEPIERQSDDLNSISANDDPMDADSHTTSSSTSFIDQSVPGTLDLTKAVDVLLKDLRDKKDTSFDFMKNLTNVLKLKDLDVFNYESPSSSVPTQQQQLNQIKIKPMEETKTEDSDFDDETVSYSKTLQSQEESCEEKFPRAYSVNNVENGFIKKPCTSPIEKSSNLDKMSSQFQADNTSKVSMSFDTSNRIAKKDELFGKLVTSMLADITDEEYKDDAKFSIMQLLVNAKRACRAKKLD